MINSHRFRIESLFVKDERIDRGAVAVVTLTILTIAIVVFATFRCWEDLIKDDTVSNVLRNMAFVAAATGRVLLRILAREDSEPPSRYRQERPVARSLPRHQIMVGEREHFPSAHGGSVWV